MTDNPTEAMLPVTPFQREERYIVIKRKHLTALQERAIRAHIARLGISILECAVVESDWPEYETVWQMIEARVTRRPVIDKASQPEREVVLEEAARYLEDQDGHGEWRDAAEQIRALKTTPTPAVSTDKDARIEKAIERAFAALEPLPTASPAARDIRGILAALKGTSNAD